MPAHDDKNRIVVGVDGSAAADAALRWAVRQAELTSGGVDAVIAWEYPASMAGYGMAPVPDYDDSAFREIAEKTLTEAIGNVVDPVSEVRVRQQVVEGNAAELLVTAAEGAGLLVVGSRGHGGFAGALLGSVSQHCVHHAHCPVVVIRGPAEGS
jgi:nucleotide-binding universal stress UspA family protein